MSGPSRSHCNFDKFCFCFLSFNFPFSGISSPRVHTLASIFKMFQCFFNILAFRFEARLFLNQGSKQNFSINLLVSKQDFSYEILYLKQEFWLFWFRSKPLLAFWNSCNTFCETIFLEPKLSIERIWIQSKTLCLNILD